MKKIFGLCLFLIFIAGLILYFNTKPRSNNLTPAKNPENSQNIQNSSEIEKITVIAENLDTPWGIVFLPDKSILITERKGTVRKVNTDGNLEPNAIATLSNVKEISEGGLLGIDIHPNFSQNNLVYVYYTYGGSGNKTLNRVSRLKYENNTFSNEEVIVDNIPGAPNHNGGRIKFGPDGNLYIGTGDAQEPSLAQDTNSLAGKILRVTDLGQPVSENPFKNRTYSYGHRNVQGITWDNDGNLWATEHGRSLPSGFDELNLIKPGQNYGWPDFEGDEAGNGITAPIKHSGELTTWAPAGCAFLEGSVYFAGLRGQTLYKAEIGSIVDPKISGYLENEFGRIRDVIVGPDKMLYITTSNRDGRGNPDETDDKIIKINPSKL